jgi:hypothetical protein
VRSSLRSSVVVATLAVMAEPYLVRHQTNMSGA